MTKTQKALAWGCLPGTVMLLNLVLYAIVSYLGSIAGPGIVTFARIFHVLQTFVGLVTLVMVPVGLVMAIIVATGADGDEKQTPPPQTPQQNA
jgi:hypothetical protein